MTTISRKVLTVIIGLLLSLVDAFGQDDLNPIRSSFNDIVKNDDGEKIFANTDKEFYLAGEIVWLKLYNVNSKNVGPAALSKLAYVEILNIDQKPIVQSKVALTDGKGNGSMYLPVSVNSGVYRLRVYTNWMKNFGADYFFEKPITIINTLKTLTIPSKPSELYNIGFFPEGGNLVQNLQSTVAFRVADQWGKGVNAKGFILTANNDTVASFQSQKFGIGRFEFTPKDGNAYKAVVELSDTMITKEFPKPLPAGYAIKVDGVNDGELKVNVSTTVQTDFVYILIHTKREIEILEKADLKDNKAEFRIPKDKLTEGISHIRILNKDLSMLCDRLFFIRPQKRLVIETELEKERYSTRKPIKLTVNANDETGKAAFADMSVAVYRMDSLSINENCGLESYFCLTSDLKGRIESPGYYFSNNSPEVNEATDNLMLVHRGSELRWSKKQDQKQIFSFPPEYKGHIIHCKVTNKKNQQPTPEVLVYLSIPGDRVQLYSSQSDSNGIARFYTKDLYGQNEVVLQTDGGDSTYNLAIIDPFSDKFSRDSLPPFVLPHNMKEMIEDYSSGMQIMNNYHAENLKQFYTPVVDSNGFYGDPDKRYRLDNFTRFSTMEEVLREYVFEVLVRRQKDNFRLIMSNIEGRQFLDDPLTLFNGVPVFNPNKIIKYDPIKVRQIDVVKSKYFYGPMILNGIINFTTYDPDPSMLSDLNAVILEYEGMQYQREFYSPVYENDVQISSRMPDFRGLLYWAPSVNTDVQGKAALNFYTSDMKGKYVVVIQGMTNDGRVGTKSLEFEVE